MGCNCNQGWKRVLPKADQDRLEICRTCPSLKRWHKGLPQEAEIGLFDRCAECGCFLRAKTALASQKCPLGKW